MTIVAVVGAGRMGSVVARQLPGETRKIVIDTDLHKARALANAVRGEANSDLAAAAEADLVAVVLPTSAVNETVRRLVGVAKKGALILNMATTATVDSSVATKNRDVLVVDAKVVGHAASMARGSAGILVVKTEDPTVFGTIQRQYPGFSVVQGDADLVPAVNTIGSTEGIKAAVSVRKQLRARNIPEDWIAVAIRTVCAGTMMSFTENDLGHFAQELARRLEGET
jgi:predicted dinucleotide-binding enzyme